MQRRQGKGSVSLEDKINLLFPGRFLSSMLEIVMRWHKDKKTYEKVLYFGVIFTFEFNDWNQVDKKTEDK